MRMRSGCIIAAMKKKIAPPNQNIHIFEWNMIPLKKLVPV